MAKFTQRMPRLRTQTPLPIVRNAASEAVFPAGLGYPNAKQLSYRNDFNAYVDPPSPSRCSSASSAGPM